MTICSFCGGTGGSSACASALGVALAPRGPKGPSGSSTASSLVGWATRRRIGPLGPRPVGDLIEDCDCCEDSAS